MTTFCMTWNLENEYEFLYNLIILWLTKYLLIKHNNFYNKSFIVCGCWVFLWDLKKWGVRIIYWRESNDSLTSYVLFTDLERLINNCSTILALLQCSRITDVFVHSTARHPELISYPPTYNKSPVYIIWMKHSKNKNSHGL